jgi:hypothetical protein
MNNHETKKFFIYILICFSFIALTTNYLDLYEIIYEANQTDAISYSEISNYAPNLPKSSNIIIQHVAQRFLLPYLTGYLGYLIEIDFFIVYKIFTFSFIIFYIFLINLLTKKFNFNLKESILFFSLLFLNPYVIRYHMFNPVQTQDMLFFCLGLIFTYTIINKNYFINIIVTSISIYLRQTSVALFIGSSIFLLINKKIKLFIILLATYFISLFLIIEVGKSISVDRFPIYLAYQLIYFDFSQVEKLIKFLLLPMVAFFPLLFVFFGKIKKNINIHSALIILFVCTMMIGQPILGGPDGSINNVGRLANLSYPILITLCFYVFDFKKKFLERNFIYFFFILGLFFWSFHPTYSIFNFFESFRFYNY